MRKIYILILAVLLPFLCFSQDYATKGDQYANSGKYADAERQYNAALAYLKSQGVAETAKSYSEIQRKLVRAQKCKPLIAQAEHLFSNAQSAESYTVAKKVYQSILSLNMSDSFSKQRVSQCDARIRQISMHKLDNELWAKLNQNTPGKALYQQYLAEFPDGAHAQEAKSALLEIEDKELWEAALKLNTRKAFENYLANENTSLFESEAQMAIYKIDDEQAWAEAVELDTEESYSRYIEDSSNPAKSYQEAATAKLSVIKTMKMAASIESSTASQKAQADAIVTTLANASKTIELSEEESKMLSFYKSIRDFEAFSSNPSISEGLVFLRMYKDSENADWVSNKVSELYADQLNRESTATDYERALFFARSDSARQYVTRKINAAKSAAKKYKRHINWSDRAQLGIGLEGEMLKNAVVGGNVEFKLGASYDRFNFSVGAKALWWKPDWLVGTDVYSISFIQAPLYATAKLNLFEAGSSNFYIAGEGAYNMNFGAKIYDGYGNNLADKNLVNKSSLSVSARIGFCWEHCDLGFFYRHDLQPVYNQQYIYQQYNDCYNEFVKVLNERFRFGVSLTCYIIL